MHLSRTDDYAVRALVDVAAHPDSPIREIAGRTDIPQSHLAKVIQVLVQAGMVETTRGRNGGVRLAREPHAISLREVLETMQGPLGMCRCPRQPDRCPRNPTCPVYRVWVELQEGIASKLEQVRVSDLLDNCRTSRGGDPPPPHRGE